MNKIPWIQTPGINIKEHDGDILIGVHSETFLQHLSENTDAKGWSNFIIKKRAFPSRNGHTHLMITEKKKSNNEK